MNFDEYKALKVERRGRVAYVTMNRPEKYNAVDARMHRELAEIFDDLNLDDSIDMAVLTGAGKAFSAGGDAAWMNELIDKDGEWQRKAVESKRVWLGLLNFEKPLVCRLNGPARGMCATIVALCDVVIAAESATLADTHVNMGLAAADGCNAIWPFYMGFGRAKDFLFNARVLSAKAAQELGLVNEVVPDAELDDRIAAYISELSLRPARTLRLTKIAFNHQMKLLVWPSIENALNLLELSNFSPEHRELVDRFNNRKRPG